MRIMYDDTTVRVGLGFDVTAFYIGGEDAYRVWPHSEIARIDTRYKLPIWVNSNPSDYNTGLQDGLTCGQWAQTMGQQKGTCISLDYETAVNARYLSGFDVGVQHYGYRCLLYGSESTVLQNPRPSGGYWVALWDGSRSLPSSWAAKQYEGDSSHPYDLSVIADATPLWDTEAPKHTGDEDMPYGQLAEGQNAISGTALPMGRYTTVGLVCDNGLQQKGAASVRVAQQHMAGDWHVQTVEVDSAKGQTVIAFVDPAHTTGISFRREDAGDVHVWYEVS